MRSALKISTLTLSILLGLSLGLASCDGGSDDKETGEEDSGTGDETVIDDAYDEWGCAEYPTDSCGQAICSILTSAQALQSVPGFSEAAVCYTDLAGCYEAACADPKNIDAKALTVCSTDLYACVCSVEALASYMAGYCDKL